MENSERFGMIALFVLGAMISVFALTQQNTEAQLNLTNANPTIVTVTGIAAQDPVENGVNNILVNFTAEDLDGYLNINLSSAFIAFTKVGEVTRSASCTDQTNTTDPAYENRSLFTCSVGMQYYDAPGVWRINATVKDINDILAKNDSTSFTYNSLKAFVMSPSTINWGSLSIKDVEKEALSPTTLNNTGNVATSAINITGADLYGQTNPLKILPSTNFYVNLTTGATGGNTLAVAGNQTAITGATLPRGAPGANQEQLFWYVNMPGFGLTAQVYATTGHTPWRVKI